MDISALAAAPDLFLEATLGIRPWSEALDVFSRGAGAVGANVMPIVSQVPGTIDQTENVKGLIDFYFKHQIYDRCIRARGVPALERRGIMVDADCIDYKDIERDYYYQEFLKPFGFLWGAYLGFHVGTDLWACLFHRSLDSQPFDREEQEILCRLRSRLTAAGTLARKLGATRVDAMSEAFDIADVGAVIFDRAGLAIRLNNRAEALFRDDIRVNRGRISTIRTDDATSLVAAVGHIVHGEPLNVPGDGLVCLARAGKPDLVMHLMRVRGDAQDIFRSAWAIGIVADPLAEQSVDQMRAARLLFQLTPAETRLAQRLVNGDNLADAAAQVGMSYQTARSYLRVMFSKTDTSKQGQLVALLSKLRI